MKYKIEVLVPSANEWVVVETGCLALDLIKKQVELIKRIYPEYVVRALDALSSTTLALV